MYTRRLQRGFSLIVAMIVIAVATMLVMGAISFTATERSAAILQTRSERLSGCAQAARNMFLAKVRVLQGNVGNVVVNETETYGQDTMTFRTGHFVDAGVVNAAGVSLTSVRRLQDNSVGGASEQVYDLSNRVGRPTLLAGYYSVSAVCQERQNGPEEEVEFVVRVGL